jgi:hypothetical protein
MDLSKFTLEELRAACAKHEAELEVLVPECAAREAAISATNLSAAKLEAWPALQTSIRTKRVDAMQDMNFWNQKIFDARASIEQWVVELDKVRARYVKLEGDLVRACPNHAVRSSMLGDIPCDVCASVKRA